MGEFIEVLMTNVSLAQRKLVYGVGINDAPYNVNNNGLVCPYYKVWMSMMRRCYKPYKGQENCSVCKEWYYFMNFRRWMESQDWKYKSLDKDILVLGNKEYGPNVCVFVSQYLNTLFQQTKNKKLPKGISWYEPTKKYSVSCRVKPGVSKFLGYYSSLKEANSVYIKAKTQILDEVVKDIIDIRVINGLHKLLLNLIEENDKKLDYYSSIE